MLRGSPSAAVQLGYMLLQAEQLGLAPWEHRARPFASAVSYGLGNNDADRAVSCFMRAGARARAPLLLCVHSRAQCAHTHAQVEHVCVRVCACARVHHVCAGMYVSCVHV